MFVAYGKRVLDTKTKVWYYKSTIKQAKQFAKEMNQLCK